jgi:hypothetical protein
MNSVLLAFGKAVWSQLHYRMLMLTVLPFVLSVVLWGLALYFGYQPMLDWLQNYFVDNDGFRVAGNALSWLGMDALRGALVPLIALWVLLPFMILTALIFVGLIAMPAIARHVGSRNYAALEKRHGGSVLGSVWLSARSFFLFLVLWLVTLPLNAIPPLTFVIQPLLWGWLTCKVMAYDALADYATQDERRELLTTLRWPLLMMGTIAGAMGAAPTLLWLGGALTVLLFPLLAGLSIWLYVLVFVFSGLWFQHYCLTALARLRARSQETVFATAVVAPGTPVMKDLNPVPGSQA